MDCTEDYTIVPAPPHNDDAERSVIGSLLLDPQKIISLSRKLNPSHFYGDHNRAIYRTILSLHARHGAVDETLVLAAMKESGGLNSFDWTAHLGECAQSVAVAAHAERYADLVIAASRQRRVIDVTQDALRRARQGQTHDALLMLQADLADISAIGHALKYPAMTVKELLAKPIATNYLIDRILVERQPCILAGPKKCLKTSLALDMAVALAVGGFFIGKFHVPVAKRVAVMSGESGLATLQETITRIAHMANRSADDLDNLIISDVVPRVGDLDHMVALERFCTAHEIDVLFIDPAYLAMPCENTGDLHAVGERLRHLNELCNKAGVTLILLHHTTKHLYGVDRFAPPELEHIAWAGYQEWCRQWILLGRREDYEPGSGIHRLWMTAGGSAGHSGRWCLDIDEGTPDDEFSRRWDVVVQSGTDAHRDAEGRREEIKRQELIERLERDKLTICETMLGYPNGETKSVIRDACGLNTNRFNPAFASLVRGKDIQPYDVVKIRIPGRLSSRR